MRSRGKCVCVYVLSIYVCTAFIQVGITTSHFYVNIRRDASGFAWKMNIYLQMLAPFLTSLDFANYKMPNCNYDEQNIYERLAT